MSYLFIRVPVYLFINFCLHGAIYSQIPFFSLMLILKKKITRFLLWWWWMSRHTAHWVDFYSHACARPPNVTAIYFHSGDCQHTETAGYWQTGGGRWLEGVSQCTGSSTPLACSYNTGHRVLTLVHDASTFSLSLSVSFLLSPSGYPDSIIHPSLQNIMKEKRGKIDCAGQYSGRWYTMRERERTV